MVRRIFIALNDPVFEELEAMKGERTWKEFLVDPLLKKTEEED